MMHFEKDYSLKPHNTFGLAAKAKLYVRIEHLEELEDLIQLAEYQNNKVLWLGGGSNMLLTQDFDGLVVQLAPRGIDEKELDENRVIVSALAGENWHEFVQYCLSKNYGGLENLSLIPGNVGTAPIQNIGAYGVEIKDHLAYLEAFDLQNGKLQRFEPADCEFDYRYSFFKGPGKGRFVVWKVAFTLTRTEHSLRTDYGAIRHELAQQNWPTDIQHIAQAVINIRQSKLPDPAKIGNSGSFFKNPVVDAEFALNLKKRFPDLVSFDLGNSQFKLAAGWLIEKAGWKGYRKGDAGVHPKQALVLVNYGGAKGVEIKELAKAIQNSVYDTFAVSLEAEVNII